MRPALGELILIVIPILNVLTCKYNKLIAPTNETNKLLRPLYSALTVPLTGEIHVIT